MGNEATGKLTVIFPEAEAWLREAKAEVWDEGHRLHSPVLEFGETPCDCRNPYRD